MPEKHPNTQRWGGPGASHEDRSKPMPKPAPAHPEGAPSTNPRVSQVSGGGGERDEKHSHVDDMRSSKSHATDNASPTSSRDWRVNRSRRDREADMAAREAIDEPRTFDGGDHLDAGHPDAPDAGHGTPVSVTCEGEVTGGRTVAGEAEQRVRKAIARFDRELSEVRVFLSEEETRTGSPASRMCIVQALPHDGEMVAVTGAAGEMDKAVTLACKELVLRLAEALGRGGEAEASGETRPRA